MIIRRTQFAFSLVELSIVLVILGLLTGGILGGQSLIRAAELRAVSTEYSRYATAVSAFRDKYFALPGDMSNATAFWGSAHGTAVTCGTTTTNDQRTCNGNGNGLIDLYDGSYAMSNEYFRFWQHLSNAGMIEGNFSGIEGSLGNVAHGVGGLNVPRSKLSRAVWYVRDLGTRSGHSELFDGAYGNGFMFGGQSTVGQPGLFGEHVLKPEEAWNIDTKNDDGMPATGRILPSIRAGCTMYPNGSAMTTDAAGAAATNATYALVSSVNVCTLIFRQVM